jgi:hypothetical protein
MGVGKKELAAGNGSIRGEQGRTDNCHRGKMGIISAGD